MKPALAFALAALSSGMQGCGAFYAEAEQARVCLAPVDGLDLAIPGGGGVASSNLQEIAGTLVSGFQGSFDEPLELDLPALLPDFLYRGGPDDYTLQLIGAETVVSNGIDFAGNLDFLRSLEISVEGPATSPIVLAAYDQATDRSATDPWLVSLRGQPSPENLIPFIRDGAITLRVKGAVSFPAGAQVPTALTARVSVCLHAKVHKSLQDLIQGT